MNPVNGSMMEHLALMFALMGHARVFVCRAKCNAIICNRNNVLHLVIGPIMEILANMFVQKVCVRESAHQDQNVAA